MARNFRIQISGTDRAFYFDLFGDFDGSSAFELLNQLQEKLVYPNQKATVNTSRLRKLHPFGRDVFRRNLARLSPLSNIVFTGKFASEIAPVEKTTGFRQGQENESLLVNRFDSPTIERSRQYPTRGNNA